MVSGSAPFDDGGIAGFYGWIFGCLQHGVWGGTWVVTMHTCTSRLKILSVLVKLSSVRWYIHRSTAFKACKM
jgi:hypothetical protein